MIKVDVLISSSLNASTGPVQTIRRIKNSKEYFCEQGCSLSVFTNDDFNKSVSVESKKKTGKWNDLRRALIRFLGKHSRFFPKMKMRKNYRASKVLLENYMQMKRDPDVIVFHSIFDCYVYLKEYRLKKAKVCLFIHDDGTGDMFFYYYPKIHGSEYEKEWRRREHFVFHEIDVKACITRTTEINLLKRAPELKGKTCLVINGISDLTKEELIESSEIRKSVDKPKYRLIQVGSMNGRKGHREVIEALHKTDSEMLGKMHVTFVGGGHERPSLERLVKKYGLGDVVTFEGVVRNCDVYKYMAQANITILISVIEGLPLALIEGLRSSLGIISTRVSGIPEIVDEGKNGVLIDPNVNDLVEVFNHMDKYDWETMGEESRKLFDDYYNFPRMRRDYCSMIYKALNK